MYYVGAVKWTWSYSDSFSSSGVKTHVRKASSKRTQCGAHLFYCQPPLQEYTSQEIVWSSDTTIRKRPRKQISASWVFSWFPLNTTGKSQLKIQVAGASSRSGSIPSGDVFRRQQIDASHISLFLSPSLSHLLPLKSIKTNSPVRINNK